MLFLKNQIKSTIRGSQLRNIASFQIFMRDYEKDTYILLLEDFCQGSTSALKSTELKFYLLGMAFEVMAK